uniref:EF-hand domain-containing protein n=1 Tax=Globodera rostochiensis TaxID=31243 RepID=A0A914GYP0_GLORO
MRNLLLLLSSSSSSSWPTTIVLLLFHVSASVAAGAGAITPIPMELLNPRLTEFRRIDSSGDDQITFSEFLLSDRPWMETISRRFHSIDANSDGKVTRKEFETFFRGKDEEQDRQRNHQADGFFKQLTFQALALNRGHCTDPARMGAPKCFYCNCFATGKYSINYLMRPGFNSSLDRYKHDEFGSIQFRTHRNSGNRLHPRPDVFPMFPFLQLTVTVGPIVEREQEGDAQNGSRRMRFFAAGARKFAAITHGTGLFPPPPSSPASGGAGGSGELASSPPLIHDYDHRHHFHTFPPHHAQFLLPASATFLGSSPQSSPSSQHDRAPLDQLSQQPAAQSAIQRERTLKSDT